LAASTVLHFPMYKSRWPPILQTQLYCVATSQANRFDGDQRDFGQSTLEREAPAMQHRKTPFDKSEEEIANRARMMRCNCNNSGNKTN